MRERTAPAPGAVQVAALWLAGVRRRQGGRILHGEEAQVWIGAVEVGTSDRPDRRGAEDNVAPVDVRVVDGHSAHAGGGFARNEADVGARGLARASTADEAEVSPGRKP